jgi:formate dehydrogenase assembly factor FdhD
MKERIAALINQIENGSITKDHGTEENSAAFDGRTCAETVALIDSLMNLLQTLNVAIEKANAVNRESLIALEMLKAKLAFSERLSEKCRRAEKFRYEENKQGGSDKIACELLIDQKALVKQVDRLKKEKQALEDHLAAVNAATFVDVDPQQFL